MRDLITHKLQGAFAGASAPKESLVGGTGVVPILQGDMLEYYLYNLDITPPEFEYYRYEGGIHERPSLIGSAERLEEFMQWIVNLD